MSTALVTGAAGFIGRHFTRHLCEQGWDVVAIDLADCLDARHTVLQWDALDFFRNPACAEYFDLVLHCAAVVGGRQVIDHDPLAQAVNLALDSAMFSWAMRTRPGRVVYFSSSAAYPVHLQNGLLARPLSEDDICLSPDICEERQMSGMPDQLYGWAKLTGELLAKKAAEAGLTVTVVRPFSGYGEDQAACYPFPAFIDRALRREDPFLVWGSGDQVRDFIHVDDIVAAVMVLAKQEIGGPVNLGRGVPVSMRDLASRICAVAGYSPRIEIVPSAPAGVSWRVADLSQMSRYYRPLVFLDEGIARSLHTGAGADHAESVLSAWKTHQVRRKNL